MGKLLKKVYAAKRNINYEGGCKKAGTGAGIGRSSALSRVVASQASTNPPEPELPEPPVVSSPNNLYLVVRFDPTYTTVNYMEFLEIEIYTNTNNNIALNKPTSAYSSYSDYGVIRVSSRVTDGIKIGDYSGSYTNNTLDIYNTAAMQYLEIDLGPYTSDILLSSVKLFTSLGYRMTRIELLFFVGSNYLSNFKNGIPNNTVAIPNSISYKINTDSAPNQRIINIPTTVSYANPSEFTVNTLITAITPTIITPGLFGPLNYTYTISPSLPNGLSINSATGIISGTPLISRTNTTYTITLFSNVFSKTTATINIQINDVAPAGL